MSTNMCANVRMEENYERLSLNYANHDEKVKIQQAIAKVENQLKLYPMVIRKNENENAGSISIEFETEGVQRVAGEFFELMLKELDITHCEN